MSERIFGYDWEDIQRMQQRQYNRPLTEGPLELPKATEEDKKLLQEFGEVALREKGLCGVLDRLFNSGLIGNR